MAKPRKKRNASKKVIDPGLVDEFLELLSDDSTVDVREWIEKNVPNPTLMALPLFEEALARCTPGSPHEAQRAFLEMMVELSRREHASLKEDIKKGNPVATLRALVAILDGQGLIPKDWETREGDPVCVTRWHHEVARRFGEALTFKEEGEMARYREALLSAREAAETCLDRVLTLDAESRGSLAADIAHELERLREICAEECGE